MNPIKVRRRIQKKRNYAMRRGRFKKLKRKWRRPFGRQGKIREHRKGIAKHPSVGDRSPTQVRGTNPKGLQEVRVFRPRDLSGIKENQIAVISSGVGSLKRNQILSEARKLKIKIANK